MITNITQHILVYNDIIISAKYTITYNIKKLQLSHMLVATVAMSDCIYIMLQAGGCLYPNSDLRLETYKVILEHKITNSVKL